MEVTKMNLSEEMLAGLEEAGDLAGSEELQGDMQDAAQVLVDKLFKESGKLTSKILKTHKLSKDSQVRTKSSGVQDIELAIVSFAKEILTSKVSGKTPDIFLQY